MKIESFRKNNTRKKLAVCLLIIGITMLLTYVVLTFILNHKATGLMGGGFGLVMVGISLNKQYNKNKKKDGPAD